MFSEELEKINWEETTQAIYAKTEADVLRALGKERCTVDDFMALISPAAEKYLEPMAQLSRTHTREVYTIFGFPVMFLQVAQVMCHHGYVGSPVF